MARRYRSTQPDMATTIVTSLGQGLWFLVSWPFRAFWKRRPIRLNKDRYLAHWEKIQTLKANRDSQHLKQAVLEADKLVDQAFRELDFFGTSFGQRLRAAETRLSRDVYQGLWEAHKLRNLIAHEVGHQISEAEAETALRQLERGLRALGAL